MEIVHPGSVGDELLREVIGPRGLDGGWISETFPMLDLYMGIGIFIYM